MSERELIHIISEKPLTDTDLKAIRAVLNAFAKTHPVGDDDRTKPKVQNKGVGHE